MQDDITQLAAALNLCVNRTVDSDMGVVFWLCVFSLMECYIYSIDLNLDKRKQPLR